MSTPNPRAAGFTLVELALVIGIVGLLLGGLMLSMSAQVELQRTSDTRATLERVREALNGFAAANGRLPCPASASSNGAEDPAGGGNCTGTINNAVHGFVPGLTLGIIPTDGQGYVVDGWGNRLRYSVFMGTIAGAASRFTTADGMKAATMASIFTYDLLRVCSSAAAINNPNTSNAICTSGNALTKQAPAVIYSTGKNGSTGGSGADEAANPNPNGNGGNDPAFVFHDLAAGGSGGAFDDMMTWISLPVLFNRLITAGRLP